MSAVANVAVDDEFGSGADFVTEFDDLGDKLVVGGDFAHFLAGS